eukprot:3663327-Rhodomonas_salina.3
MPGTDRAYGATSFAIGGVLWSSVYGYVYTVARDRGSRTVAGKLCYLPTRVLCSTNMALGATCLRPCYTMPDTARAHGAISLRACYAMPGTDTARGTMMHGTDQAYGATSLLRGKAH